MRVTGAVLGIFALLAQLSLPTVHHAAMAASAGQLISARAAALFGGDVPICLTQQPDKPAGSGIPSQAPSHKVPACPICQTLHALGSLLPPAGIVIAEGPPPATTSDVLLRAPIIAHTLNPTSRPRAPPRMA
jgi:hypothetical protein